MFWLIIAALIAGFVFIAACLIYRAKARHSEVPDEAFKMRIRKTWFSRTYGQMAD